MPDKDELGRGCAPEIPPRYGPLGADDRDDAGTPSPRSDDRELSAEVDCDSPAPPAIERLIAAVPIDERERLVGPLRITGGSDALDRTGGGRVRESDAGRDGDTACATNGGRLSGATTWGRAHSRVAG